MEPLKVFVVVVVVVVVVVLWLTLKIATNKLKIYDYNILKANFLFNFHQPENIIYGQEQNLSKEMLDSKANLVKTRESLSETINKFKNLNEAHI